MFLEETLAFCLEMKSSDVQPKTCKEMAGKRWEKC